MMVVIHSREENDRKRDIPSVKGKHDTQQIA
jgi:hypothetical protein